MACIQEDRLSSLPDILIGNILSLIPTKSAIATSVLSKRWRNFWTQVSECPLNKLNNLSFSLEKDWDCSMEDYSVKLCNFFTGVDHVLDHLTSSTISSFDFSYKQPNFNLPRYSLLLESLVRRVCALHPETIEVQNTCIHPCLLDMFPSFVLDCSSLVSLKVDNAGFIYKLPDGGTVTLPNLKNLSIIFVDPNSQLMATLFKSCPLLEDLRFATNFPAHALHDRDLDHALVIDISSRSLRRLEIFVIEYRCCRFIIDTPKLEEIKLESPGSSVFRFVEKPMGLCKAYISLDGDFDKAIDLLAGISGVKYLSIGGYIMQDVRYSGQEEFFPIFHNLVELNVGGQGELLNFEKCVPGIEVLGLSMYGEDDVFHCYIPSSLLAKLKRVEIDGFSGANNEHLDIVKHILKEANVLELLVLRLSDDYCSYEEDSNYDDSDGEDSNIDDSDGEDSCDNDSETEECDISDTDQEDLDSHDSEEVDCNNYDIDRKDKLYVKILRYPRRSLHCQVAIYFEDVRVSSKNFKEGTFKEI